MGKTIEMVKQIIARMLDRFKNWLSDRRSFIFSWYTKDTKKVQEPEKSLAQLPIKTNNKLVDAVKNLPGNPADKKAIAKALDRTKEWRLRVKQFLPFLRMVVLSVTTIVLMNLFLNLSKENILAVTGTVAVALGFAFKDFASSIIAGIVGLFESPYGVGDRIKIGEHYGEVVSYGLRSVQIITPDDNTVTIPHNKIWTEALSNSNGGNLEAQVVTEFYFAHEIEINLVKKILYRVAQTSKYTALKLPIVVVMEEKPWGTAFKLKAYPLDARDEFIYKTDLITRAKQAFAKHKLNYPRVFNTKDMG